MTTKTYGASTQIMILESGIGNKKKFEFCAAIIMTVVNRTFRKKERHLVIYEFDSSKKYVDYCVVMKNQTKFVKHLLKSVPTDW